MGRKHLKFTVKTSTHKTEKLINGKKKEECHTDKLQKEAIKELKKQEIMLDKIEEFQKNAPIGCLKYQKRGRKTYHYHQFWDENSRGWVRKYIKKENSILPKKLAQKHYYMEIHGVLDRNVSALKNFIQQYHPEKLQEIYDGLGEVRKRLIDAMVISERERVKQWNSEEYEGNSFHPENLRFETEQGEFVRSKSEVIIANILYQHRKDILYKYEKPLELLVDRKVKTIYPDFTIMNIHTGKIWYWEHAGRMDDVTYANEFAKKTNTYVTNGFLPGKDVIFTYETMANPLEIFAIRRIVEDMLVGE